MTTFEEGELEARLHFEEEWIPEVGKEDNTEMPSKKEQATKYQKWLKDNICPHTTNPIQLKRLCKRCSKEANKENTK